MPKPYKFATTSTRLEVDGIPLTVVRNMPYDAECRLVQQHPEFFQDEPIDVISSEAAPQDLGPRVEAATRAPGEQRNR
jgi:hypothetical protein